MSASSQALRPDPVGATTSTAARPATPLRLSVTGLQKRFGDREALSNLTFAIAPGEIVGLLGPNGAGKTTAFRILSGLIAPDEGRIVLDGAAINPTSAAYRQQLGVVFQDPSLDLKLTGRENLALGAALYGLPPRLAATKIDESLNLMQLRDRADEPVQRYSGGMRRRLEIARVLLHRPTLLLLDEPGRGIDPETLRRVWDELASVARERGTSVLVTTHQPEEAERCHRAVFIDAGRVVATGTPDELRARVAGDLIRIDADGPDEVAAAITARLGLGARVVDGRVTIEAARGHEVVPRIVELFPAGRLRSVATARPTLADVFTLIAGHGLS